MNELPLPDMGPPVRWRWRENMPESSQMAVACVLWTILLDGPFNSETGQTPRRVGIAVRERSGPYTGAGGQRRISDVFQTLRRSYPHLVTFETKGQQTFRIAIAEGVGPDDLPPNPYRDRAMAPEPKRRGRPPKNADQPANVMTAADALAAVDNFVQAALKMCGQGSGGSDRLAEAEARIEQLERENDVLKRALAARNGQALR